MSKRAFGTGGLFKMQYVVREQGRKVTRETKCWYMQYTDANGKRHRESTHKESKLEANEVLLAKLKGVGLMAPTPEDVKSLKWETVRDSWLNAPRKKSPTGKVRSVYTTASGERRVSGLKHLDEFFKGWDIVRIQKPTLEVYKASREKAGYSQTTIAKQLRLLHAILQHGHKHFGLPAVPDFSLSMPTVDNVRQGYTTEKAFSKLAALLPEVCRMVATYQYSTGRRTGEVLALRWEMVNADYTEVNLPGEITKSGKASTVPLVGEHLETISKWMRKQFRKSGAPVFPVGKESYRYHWNRACGKLGLGTFDAKTRRYSGLRPHDLRRTVVRNMTRAGIDRSTAMLITGHKTESMYRRYNIIETEDVAAALKKTAESAKVKAS